MADVTQGSPEWLALRCGKVTASRVHDTMATRKDGKPSASRTNYLAEIVAERLTGVPAERFTNAAMAWGTEQESAARAAYAMLYAPVREVGFVKHPTIADSGASPDGLVGDDGLVEIKCPNVATHIDTLLGASIDAHYLDQMQWQMACTGRRWCDFISFDPRMPGAMQLHVQRVEIDVLRVAELEAAVVLFLAQVEGKVEALRARYEMRAAA
jgi:putative phage-type endonuclease